MASAAGVTFGIINTLWLFRLFCFACFVVSVVDVFCNFGQSNLISTVDRSNSSDSDESRHDGESMDVFFQIYVAIYTGLSSLLYKKLLVFSPLPGLDHETNRQVDVSSDSEEDHADGEQ